MKTKLPLLALALCLTFATQAKANLGIFGKCCNYLHPSGWYYCDSIASNASASMCRSMCIDAWAKDQDAFAAPYYFGICSQATISDVDLF
jgi:hypothetical protein